MRHICRFVRTRALRFLVQVCLLAIVLLCGLSARAQSQIYVLITGQEGFSTNAQLWDQGVAELVVNGTSKKYRYGQFSNPASIASALAAEFSADSSSPVWALSDTSGGIQIVLRSATGSISAVTMVFTPDSETDEAFAYHVNNIGSPGSLGVTCTPNSIYAGGSVVCTASLWTDAQGSIGFSLDGTFVGEGGIASGGASISLNFPDLTVGSHTVSAYFGGDHNYPSASGSAQFALAAPPGPSGGSPVAGILYSYSFTQPDGTTSGYDGAGNIVAYTDSVNGQWQAGYDSLSRLQGAVQAQVNGAPLFPSGASQLSYCWVYDDFGNRKQQVLSTQGFSDAVHCKTPATASTAITSVSFGDNTNRITDPGTTTDAAGYIIEDPKYSYLYDGDGKLCALRLKVTNAMTGYLYDAEGQRVAMGSITAWGCDPATNGFTVISEVVRGTQGEQLAEFNGANQWAHTTVQANGQTIATLDTAGTHLQLNDWLGTRRVQTNAQAVPESTCSGAPFGDGMTCGATASELYFTGKERDAESGGGDPSKGLDYFGARYYNSTLGRWMSADWSDDPEPIPYVDYTNPQTLNLYGYAFNSPLEGIDADGHITCTPGGWDEVTSTLTAASCNYDFGDTLRTLFLFGQTANLQLSTTVNRAMVFVAPSLLTNTSKSRACRAEALSKNGVSLSLDAVAALTPVGGSAALIVQTGLGIISIAHSATSGDQSATGLIGIGASFTSFQVGVARAAASAALYGTEMGVARTLAKGLVGFGKLAGGVALGADVYTAIKDYNSCMAR